MSWSWTAFVPLSDAHASPDAAHLCGERVVVELTEETHFHIDSDIDLRRVRRRDEDGRVQREADVMTLRVRSASHFSAGVECWISRPKLRLKCGPDATVEDAWLSACRGPHAGRDHRQSAPWADRKSRALARDPVR